MIRSGSVSKVSTALAHLTIAYTHNARRLVLRVIGTGMYRFFRAGFTCSLLAFASSAFATSQCPSEFATKDPSVNAIGWLVVAVGIILGGLLLGFVIKRSRGSGVLTRIAFIGLAIVGMVFIGVAGLALAIADFFLQC